MFAVFDNFGAAAAATMDLELDGAPRSGPLLGTEHGRQRKELNGRSLKPRRRPTRINRKVQDVPTFSVTTTASIQSEESRPVIDFDSISAGIDADVGTASQPEISINMPVTPNNSMKIGRLRQTNTAHIDCIKMALKARKGGNESPTKKAKMAPPVATRTPPRAAALRKTAPPLYAKPALVKSSDELAMATLRLKKKPVPAPPAKKSKPAVAPPSPAKAAPKPPAKKAKAKAAPPVPPKKAKEAKEAPAAPPKVAAKVPPRKPETKPKLSKASVPLPATAAPVVATKPAPPATLPKPSKQSAAMPEADVVLAPEEPADDEASAAPATPQKESSPEMDDADAVCPPTVSRALTLSAIDKELGQHLTAMVAMSAARIANEDALLKQSAYRSAGGSGKSLLDLFCAEETAASTNTGAEACDDNEGDAELAEGEADTSTLAEAGADPVSLFTRTESDDDYIALGAPPAPPTVPEAADEGVEDNQNASEKAVDVPCPAAVAEVVDDIISQLVQDAAATASVELDTHADEPVIAEAAEEGSVSDAAADTLEVPKAAVETVTAATERPAVTPKVKLVEERTRPFLACAAQPPVTSKRRPTNTGAPLHERLAVLQKADKVRSTPLKNTAEEASVSTPCMKHLQSAKGAVGKLAARFENVSTPTKASAATPESSEEPLWKLALNKARQYTKVLEPSSPRRASNHTQPSWKKDFEKVRKERKPVSQSKKDWQKAPKSSKENVMSGGVPGWKVEFERMKSKKRRSSVERGVKPFGQSASPNKKPTNPSASKFTSLVAATNASAPAEKGGKPTWMKQAQAARRRRNGGLY